MTWLLFSLLSICFMITYGLISKKILTDKSQYNPITFASALFVSVAIYSFVLYLITGFQSRDFLQLLSPSVLPILALNLICYTIAPSLYYRALKNLPISEVTILYSMTGIYIMIIGIALGTENFSLTRLVGGLLIISSIVLLSIKEKKWHVNKYVLMLVGATLIYSVAALTDNRIIESKYFNPLFFQTLTFGIPSILILVVNPSARKHLRVVYNFKTLPSIFFNGIFFFISFFTVYQAYNAGGKTSQVNLVLATETIVMVIFAALFLKERDNLPIKVVAALLAGVGAYLLR